ncbi:MAG: MarR family transcriptional regulator [Spirochaetia bacterium]|nr:MarR family transcriptional regulator [Spirochaetia bacterium]
MVELNSCVNFLLTKAQLAVNQEFKLMLADYEITPVQCGVLNCLYKQDGQGLKALSDELSVNASTMTGIIDRMEAKGFIERRADPQDRRAQSVFLTQRGFEVEDIATRITLEANEKVLGEFSPEEEEVLKKLLKVLGDRR